MIPLVQLGQWLHLQKLLQRRAQTVEEGMFGSLDLAMHMPTIHPLWLVARLPVRLVASLPLLSSVLASQLQRRPNHQNRAGHRLG